MRILFFGSLSEAIGRELDVDVPDEGCTVAALRARLAREHGALAQPNVRACIDREIAPETARVRPGQEVAFVPPLSGG